MSDLLAQLMGLLFALGICAALIAVGVSRMRKRSRVVADGVHVRATIVSVRVQSVDSTYAYHPTVRYELYGRVWESVPAGGQHSLRTGTVMKSRATAEQFVGQPLDILVDPQQPSVSAVPGRDRLGFALVTVGIVFGVLVLGLGGLGIALGALMS